MAQLTLTPKQGLAWELLEDPRVVELDYGGGAGGGKTLLVCLWAAVQCRKYGGIRIGLGRKELARLKDTTMASMLGKAHPLLGISHHDFIYRPDRNMLTYRNGSELKLVDLAPQPSDPDFDTFGSLELTHAVIEEAGEVKKKAKTALQSRINRWKNDEYGITGKLVLTQNPSRNFTRQMYYDPYKRLGEGDFQKWPSGQVDINGKLETAFTAFVHALVTDNPLVSRNYVETLKNLPPQEKKRLLKGDWNYMDDEDMLFPSIRLDRAMISERPEGKRKILGVDPADKGKDKTMVSLVEDGVLVRQKRLTVDTTGEKPISELYAKELIKFAQQCGITQEMAADIGIEGNGVGVGMRDFMRSKGWMITVFESTESVKSQAYYDWAMDMDESDAKVWSELENLDELRRQLGIPTFEFDNGRPKVMPKKKWKEELGYSPDESDSGMIANWIRRGGAKANKKQGFIIY